MKMKILSLVIIAILAISIVDNISAVDVGTSDEGNIPVGPKIIKLGLVTGSNAIANCVRRTKDTISAYNNNHPEVNIQVTEIPYVNTIADLNNIDVILLPGGSHGRDYFTYINGNVIREFVSSGHGYIGICAGAYAGVAYVDGNYAAYNVAPHINAKSVYHEGIVTTSLTDNGRGVFNMEGNEYNIDHENGPAMYKITNDNPGIALATYNSIPGYNYNGYISVAYDFYGNGRTILFGPHPEADNPRYPDMLGNSIRNISP